MKIFHALVIFLIIVLSLCTVITSPNQCTCRQIQYQQDCLSVYIPNPNSSLGTTCRWILSQKATGKQAKGVCLQGIVASTTTSTLIKSTYCNNIIATQCAATFGCALPDGKVCIAFTGCSAYVFSTNTECQAVSTQCTTDGTQCSNKSPCSYYTSQISNCGLYSSSSGTGTCKVQGSLCVDQTCSDAPSYLKTNTACNSFLSGCVSNGAGCVATNISCSHQTGDATTCPTFIGLVPSEGQCKYSGSGNICAGRTCADAPTTVRSNAQCIEYLPSCLYTIGMGCTSVIQNCSQLNFALGCSNLQNTRGVGCIDDTSSNPPTQCREVQCSDNKTGKSIEECNTKGLIECFSNGAGCIEFAIFSCKLYKGTNEQCAGLIGPTGKCKGIATEPYKSQACVASTCEDAPLTMKTDKECDSFQMNCVTNGKGCSPGRKTCWDQVIIFCEGYIGADGLCTMMTGAYVCSAKTCAGASTVINTTINSGCVGWYPYISDEFPGCVSDGNVCVQGGSCDTLPQISCTGYNNCSFTKSCVNNTQCENYTTQSQCISNLGQFGRSCIWNGSCVPTPCTAIWISTTIDPCQHVPGCYYQGIGDNCNDETSSSISCNIFSGDNSFTANRGCAALFHGRCASADSSNSFIVPCVARTCSNFYQTTTGPTTTAICDAWLSGCLSNGQFGCVSTSSECTEYFGTQIFCNSILANGRQCYNSEDATLSTNCVVKKADMILQTTIKRIWTDEQCNAALQGTVSSQKAIPTIGTSGVCVENTMRCTSFSGSYTQCSSIVNLREGKCTKTAGFCYPKLLVDCNTVQGTSIQACQLFSYNCIWASGMNSGNYCTNYVPCTSYIGSPANCNQLTDGLGLRCGSKLNLVAQCIYANFCTDYLTGGSTDAIRYCASLQDTLGNTCSAATNIDAICSYPQLGNKSILGVGQCSGLSYIVDGTCVPITLSTQCTDLSGPYFMNASNCQATMPTCTWAKGRTCILAASITLCTEYNLPGSQVAQSPLIGNAYCTQFSGATGKCWYIGDGNTCTEPMNCASYTPATVGQPLSATVCAQFQSPFLGFCGFDGTVCQDPLAAGYCASIPVPAVTLVLAQMCQATVETFSPCSLPIEGFCGVSQNSCTAYLITGLNTEESAILCQGYFIEGGQRCGFIIGSTSCSNRTCGDYGVTIQTCSTYSGSTCGWNTLTSTCSTTRTCSDGGVTQSNCASYIGTKCEWIGGACVLRSTVTTCSQYQGSSIATCNLLFDRQGRQCGWRPSELNCSDYQCSQIPAQATVTTHQECQVLNPACTASATSKSCVGMQMSCYKYTASLADCVFMKDSQGIQCSNQNYNGQCTYSTTDVASLNTKEKCLINPDYSWNGQFCHGISRIVAQCSTANAIGNSFSEKLAYCQSLISNSLNGASCFYTQFKISGEVSPFCIDSAQAASTQTSIAQPNCQAANISNKEGHQSPGTGSDADCAAFSNGCTALISQADIGTTVTSCTLATCSMANAVIATSTFACQEFQTGCIWNGSNRCIRETESECQSITGTVTSCIKFVVNKILCYQPITTAINSATATACAPITCTTAPSTITNDVGCEIWYPSIYSNQYNSITNPGPNLNCVWTGTTGCTVPQACSTFRGNVTTCPTFTAIDGPCKAGTGANCTPVICTDAPNSYITDAQCANFANSNQQCLTTGYGCAARSMLSCNSIINQQSCISSSLGGVGTNQCSWLSQCVASVITCTDPSLSTATLCITTPILGARCAWNPYTNSCQKMTCVFLSATLTTHQACSAKVSTCTTTGAGCITLGPCASYTAAGQQACFSANNQEAIESPQVTECIWANNACRVITCTDNTIASTNSACNVNGLTQCVTTGQGCVQIGTFECGQLLKSSACLSDGQGNPCIWLNGQCQTFTGCTSIAWTTYALCSKIGCTTNGTNCIALNSCSNYTTAASCLISNTNQTCGWLQAGLMGKHDPQCIVFERCTDGIGATNAICQLYNSNCISNGISCQNQQTCSTYTQYACLNSLGTDGQCFWSTTNSTSQCRTQQCSDYIGQNPTDAICASFPAPVINTCTTNGTTCVKRSTCSSYTTKDGCVIGTDGTCFWDTTGFGSCRIKMCTDAQFTSNALCGNLAITVFTTMNTKTKTSFLQCVSNGTTCIAKSNCSYYTTEIACQGGGLDGSCAFTPSKQSGTCTLMTSCSNANSDQLACFKAYDRCFYQNQTCSPLTCDQAAGFSSCKPIPSFDYSSYQVCGPVSPTNSTCVPQDASQLIAATCFNSTLSSYTWNDTSSSCNFCGDIIANSVVDVFNQTSTGIFIANFIIYGALLANI